MKNLYIDFDGVISDTIDVTYKMMEIQKINKNNFESVALFYQKLDWEKLLNKTPLINDSMNKIVKIIDANIYDVAILTHVNSQAEAVAKIRYIRRFLSDITIIAVPKEVAKTEMVCAKNSILIDDYTGNLDTWTLAGGTSVKFSKRRKKSSYTNINDLEEILNIEFSTRC